MFLNLKTYMANIKRPNIETLPKRYQQKTERNRTYRELVVRVLLSLPHRPGILEFMYFIYCVEAAERGNRHRSKFKVLRASHNLIQRLIALLQVKHRTGPPQACSARNCGIYHVDFDWLYKAWSHLHGK